jgi:hypothetical protein
MSNTIQTATYQGNDMNKATLSVNDRADQLLRRQWRLLESEGALAGLSSWKVLGAVRKAALSVTRARRLVQQGELARAYFEGDDISGPLSSLENIASLANMVGAKIDAAANSGQSANKTTYSISWTPTQHTEPMGGYVEGTLDGSANEDGRVWKEFATLDEVPQDVLKSWARSAYWSDFESLSLKLAEHLPRADASKPFSVNWHLNQLGNRYEKALETLEKLEFRADNADEWVDGKEPYALNREYSEETRDEFILANTELFATYKAIKSLGAQWAKVRAKYNEAGGNMAERNQEDPNWGTRTAKEALFGKEPEADAGE